MTVNKTTRKRKNNTERQKKLKKKKKENQAQPAQTPSLKPVGTEPPPPHASAPTAPASTKPKKNKRKPPCHRAMKPGGIPNQSKRKLTTQQMMAKHQHNARMAATHIVSPQILFRRLPKKQVDRKSPEEYHGENLKNVKFFPADGKHAKVIIEMDDGGTVKVLHCFDQYAIKHKYVARLHHSLQKIVNDPELAPWELLQHPRGQFKVKHYCRWKKYSKHPFISKDACGGFKCSERAHRKIRRFFRKIRSLWRCIANLIRTHFPEEYALLKEAAAWYEKKEMKWFALLFPGLAANIRAVTTCHRDSSDLAMGICAVLPWGGYKGGHLVFDELESIFEWPLAHSNMEIKEVWNDFLQCKGRQSIVLFSCANLMKYWSKEAGRPITMKDFTHYEP
ncbi:hypothetical protein HK097_009865 [Rhizophlyctis rosea]|uniref:Uncharacterized protein n=1 Tax=Rhizophlyctis rosea TaxID=64517 RepID=A0AAD5X050_9FUNG|nr:hypothetical protein HK097_009865 [Rhizophlyctis rosea]